MRDVNANDPTPKGSSRSVIGAGIRIRGNVSGETDMEVHGSIQGDCHVDGRLVVSASARIEGHVESTEAVLGGEIHGNVTAERIELLATARLVGDVRVRDLVIEDGARFEGRVDMTRDGASIADRHAVGALAG